MNKAVIDRIIEQKPSLKQSRETLESMQVGKYCLHRAWGLGKIVAFDEMSQKLIIDFESDKKGHAMDPVFCVDKLEILADDNLLVRHRKDPQLIHKQAFEKPVDLVIEFLLQSNNHAATTLELENFFRKLLGEEGFRKWWLQAKKLLTKDKRINFPTKKSMLFTIKEEPSSPEDDLILEFLANKNARKKLHIAEKLLQALKNSESQNEALLEVIETLKTFTQDQEKQVLTPLERLQAAWMREDLKQKITGAAESDSVEAESIIQEHQAHLSLFAEHLSSAYCKRFLSCIQKLYPENWKYHCLGLLRDNSGKFVNESIHFLIEKGEESSLKSALQKWLDEQTLKGPILYWLIKNRRPSGKFNSLIKDLDGPKLLGAVLSAIDYEALHLTGTRHVPLAELINDDKTLISDLLVEASPETAHDLAQTLILNQGFEELTKRSILARFIKHFPTIQKLVSGNSDHSKKNEHLIVSAESFAIRKKELESLIHEKIPENKQAIATARDFGDLKENSEYKMARQDQETLMARKAQLEKDLGRASITDFKDAAIDSVSIGSYVELLQGSTNKTHTFSILGAWDSNPDRNVLSYKTPLAQGLLSKKVGDSVTLEIGGVKETWKICSIGKWVDLMKKTAAAKP
jgi:transcription elongation factor GreA